MPNLELADRINNFITRCTPLILPGRVIHDALDLKYLPRVEQIARETELEIPDELRQALETLNYSLEWAPGIGITAITFMRKLAPNPVNEIKLSAGEKLPRAQEYDLGNRDGQDLQDERRFRTRGTK